MSDETEAALDDLQTRVRAHLTRGGEVTECLRSDELAAVADKTVAEGLDALVALDDAIARYRAHQQRIGGLLAALQAALRPDRQVRIYDMVRLTDDYDEHPDNVGDRTGRLLKRGTGDWEGFVRVDFSGSGGKPLHWVPDSAVRPA